MFRFLYVYFYFVFVVNVFSQTQTTSDSSEFYLATAESLVKSKNYKLAMQNVDKVRRIFYEQQNWTKFVHANILKAYYLRLNSQYGKSIDLLESTLKLAKEKLGESFDDKKLIYSNLGDAYAKGRSNYDHAISLYTQALELTPNDTSLKISIAEAYALKKDYDTAIKLYEQLSNEFPSHYLIHIGLGWTHYRKGDFQNCIKYSEKASEMDSTRMRGRYHAALSYLRLGDIEKSKTLYRAAKQNDELVNQKFDDDAISGLLDLIFFEKKMEKEAWSILKEVFNKDSSGLDGFAAYDTPPELVGGYSFVKENLKYPEGARKAGIEGKTLFKAIIDEEGYVLDVAILKEEPQGYGFGAAGAEVVSKMKFRPAKSKSKPIKVAITLPITFKLK